MKLRHINHMINEICSLYQYDPKNIENDIQYMTEEDQSKLQRLLKFKLELQKEAYKKQGGNLDNVIFLAKHR